MTYEMEYLMHLYSCGALGKEAQPPKKQIDWEKLVGLAVEQSITYTAAMPIKKYGLGCPAEIQNRLTASMRGAAVKNSIKTDGILELVESMESEGIRVLVIKGVDVARLYRNPECRVSSDTDLLISQEDEDRAYQFLENYGFKMERREPFSNHDIGTHPKLGTVELHIKLIPDIFTNALMSNWNIDESALKTCRKVKYQNKEYYSLETTNNLLFLTYHMIKHFLYSGISLRMMMDNALFAKFNIDDIDSARYKKLLGESNFLYVMQIIFGAMVKYCGFESTDFPIEPILDTDDILSMLDDLEKRGWQGFKEEESGQDAWFFYRYNNALLTNDKNELDAISDEHLSTYKKMLFPPLEYMEKKYPKLKKHSWLYLYFALHRFFTRGIKILWSKRKMLLKKAQKESDLSDDAKERIDLFKKLKVI